MRVIQFSLLVSMLAGGALCNDVATAEAQRQAAYVLQPSDEIALHSLQVKEMADKTFRLDQEGNVNFPLIGRIHLSGLTVPGAEELLVGKLKTYYVQPDVELNVSALHSEPLSIIGAVGTPGIHDMKGRTTLLDALSSAGGVRGDAGPVVLVTREQSYGSIPYSNAHSSATGESIAEIDLKSLLDARDPSENIVVRPHDVISVPPAQVVYVVGNVKRAGGFPLGGKSNFSVLQALALAEGLDPRAAPERARILRKGNGPEQQIAIDLRKILKGKAEDVTLRPNDVLFVPSSVTKAITQRTIDAAIQVGTGVAIFAH